MTQDQSIIRLIRPQQIRKPHILGHALLLLKPGVTTTLPRSGTRKNPTTVNFQSVFGATKKKTELTTSSGTSLSKLPNTNACKRLWPLPGRKVADYTSQARVNIKQAIRTHFKLQAQNQFSVEKI